MLKHLERAAEFRARAALAAEALSATALPMVHERLARAAASWQALAEVDDAAARGRAARFAPASRDLETTSG